VLIELFQFFRRNPIFFMYGTPNNMSFIFAYEVIVNLKLAYITYGSTRSVPIPGDLFSILKVRYRIEKGLPRQPGRERPKPGLSDFITFTLTKRALQNH